MIIVMMVMKTFCDDEDHQDDNDDDVDHDDEDDHDDNGDHDPEEDDGDEHCRHGDDGEEGDMMLMMLQDARRHSTSTTNFRNREYPQSTCANYDFCGHRSCGAPPGRPRKAANTRRLAASSRS